MVGLDLKYRKYRKTYITVVGIKVMLHDRIYWDRPIWNAIEATAIASEKLSYRNKITQGDNANFMLYTLIFFSPLTFMEIFVYLILPSLCFL